MKRTLSHSPGATSIPERRATSRSSKSSSLTTSSTNGALADLSHFEDIGLDDDHASYQKSQTAVNNGPLAKGSSLTGGGRPLINSSRAYTQVINPGNIVRSTSPLPLALPNGPQRAKTSPNLGVVTSGHRNASRSPSPTAGNHRPLSPQRLNRMSSNNSLRGVSGPLQTRKSSGPKPRKTAKEIEAEYHDSDEDLPEDANLANVPLSPGLFRTASSAANSTNVSASTSPERPSYLKTSPSLGHLRTSKTMPLAPKPFPPRTDSSMTAPTSPRFQSRASTGSLDTYGLGKMRAKSWSNVLSDLSEDVMALSEALDAHATENGEHSGMYVRDQVADKRRVKSSIVELPPLRKNNVMIDPLPISKEKEKVLSRTRPSWLPPKSQKEEARHLKEYKRMMEASMEAEKKRATKAATAKCARDDTAVMLQRIWDDHVLPNWSQATKEPRTRELWWRGIPPRARPEVWKRAITNELGLTGNTYAKALARARAIDITAAQANSTSSPDVSKELVWLQAIRRDIKQTLPTLRLFQAGQPLHEPLTDILSAYAMYRSDIGYVYGTHLPAALLLLTLSSANDAFVALANYLNRPLPLAFLVGDNTGTARTYDLILNLLWAKRPRLHERLFGSTQEGNLGLHPEQVFEPLIRTLFLNGCCEPDNPSAPPTPMTASAVKSSFPSFSFTLPTPRSPRAPTSPQTPSTPGFSFRGVLTSSSKGISLPLAQRLWDVIVFDGDAAIIRACVGILAAKESALYGSKESVLEILGWNGSLRLGEDSGSFGGLSGSSQGSTPTSFDPSSEEAEAVERIMTLIRGIGKEDRRPTNEKISRGDSNVRDESGSSTVVMSPELGT